MASPAHKPPAGSEHNDEALDILRRLEPALERIEAEQKEQRRDIVKLKEDVAEIKGRLGELSARVPSIWTIAGLIFAYSAPPSC